MIGSDETREIWEGEGYLWVDLESVTSRGQVESDIKRKKEKKEISLCAIS
jgi:hypothetical protein